MKAIFNEIGLLESFDKETDLLNQGAVGIILTAQFKNIINSDYVAFINFTRSDGNKTNRIIMNIDSNTTDSYKFLFEDEWFFAKDGETSFTIFLIDGVGNIIAQGSVKFNIAKNDYDSSDPTITITQYNSILSALATKLDKVEDKTTLGQFYGKTPSGTQTMVDASSSNDNSTAVLRTKNGTIKANDPIEPNDLTTKHYVDNKTSQIENSIKTSVEDLNNKLNQKFDKTGGTIDGDVQINGNIKNDVLNVENNLKVGNLITTNVLDVNEIGNVEFTGHAFVLSNFIDAPASVVNKDYVDTSLIALKDKLFDVIATTLEEDITTDSYVVPSNFDGHGLIESVPCEVKSISGETRQFNQLFNSFRTVSVNGCDITPLSNGKGIHIQGTAESNSNTWVINLGSDYTKFSNHKMLVKNNSNIVIRNNDFGRSINQIGYISGQYFVIDMIAGTTYDNDIELQLFDLTLMGLDSITNVDDFKTLYPLNYYAYDSGSIKNVSLSKIESYGYNALAAQPILNTGVVPFNANIFSRMIAGHKYTIEFDSLVNATAYRWCMSFYDMSGNLIQDQNNFTFSITSYFNSSGLCMTSYNIPATTKSIEITPNVNCYVYVNFGLGDTSSSTIMKNVVLHLSSVNLGYKPYVGKIGTINLGTTDLNGLGNAKDIKYFDSGKITRRISVVDLGTLNYFISNTNKGIVGTESLKALIKAPTSNDKIANIICGNYTTTKATNLYTDANEIIAVENNGTVDFKSSAFVGKNATEIKALLSGVPLYFERATPIEEEGTPITNRDLTFEIGGTIINDNSNTNYNVKATTTIDFVCKDWSI